jgi:probable F420-dependent oxidoreductase
MRFGVTLPAVGALAAPDELAAVAVHAEALGFDSVWVTYHVAMPVTSASSYPYGRDGRMTWAATTAWLDPLTALTWVAAATAETRLGTSILVAPLRNPLLLAKQAASLDYLAGGRVVLGVGAGWLAEEFALVEAQFEGRYARLGEQIDLMRRCWAGGQVQPYHGAFYNTDAFVMAPPPPRGDIPVYVGGQGKGALRLVARHGDGWHPTHITPAQYAERLTQLDPLLAAAGRSRDELDLTVRLDSAVPLDADIVAEFSQLGVSLLVFDPDYSRGTAAACSELETAASIVGLAPRSL